MLHPPLFAILAYFPILQSAQCALDYAHTSLPYISPFVLLLITPGDSIFQAYQNRQLYNIFVIAGVNFLTLVLAILLYASPLYTNRSALASIPKVWIPIEKGVVSKGVRRMVIEGLARNARIAYEADLKVDVTALGNRETSATTSPETIQRTQHREVRTWGNISHPGWSSPSSPDLPNLHFEPVILELPHLIEAKAVSLAPPHLLFEPELDPQDPAANEVPLPDALAVELLQRPTTMGLRDYITQLTSLGMINPPALGPTFLYEEARFSGHGLDELAFRFLMHIFAEILRAMKELNPDILADLRAEEDAASDLYDGDEASLMTTETMQRTPRPEYYEAEGYADEHSPQAPRLRSQGQAFLYTGHSSPGARRTSTQERADRAASRSGSSSPIGRVRTRASTGSTQGSAGSVIRLAEARTSLDLPYAITMAPPVPF
ncbi:hypothetical protein LPUS_03613 [Lasallia pustulata]|uniref:Defect at low temperature protein 1 n=1 Tax=Lasallia pustulata TaxID=136370 RepID=A0A1W5CUY7_9LECA|nr:hypothetical protein LPUS_03613 [Lasallia pustulata]